MSAPPIVGVPLLILWVSGPSLADDLADLLPLELADEPRAREEREEHRRDRGGDDAERDVPEDVEPAEPAGVVAERDRGARRSRAGSRFPCSARAPRRRARRRRCASPSRGSTSPARFARDAASAAVARSSGASTTATPRAAARSSATLASPPHPIGERHARLRERVAERGVLFARARAPSSCISPRTATARRPLARASSASVASAARMLAGLALYVSSMTRMSSPRRVTDARGLARGRQSSQRRVDRGREHRRLAQRASAAASAATKSSAAASPRSGTIASSSAPLRSGRCTTTREPASRRLALDEPVARAPPRGRRSR